MLGDHIKQIRIAKGLSQEELAVALNVVRQTVSKWEKGLSTPDSDMLVRLAHVLDTSVNDLLGEKEPMAAVTDTSKKPALTRLPITLIVLGFPIWFSLIAAALAVVLALYVAVWAVDVSLWAVDVSLAGSCVGGIAAGVIFLCTGSGPSGLAMIAGALICAGLAILLFFGCKAATNGIVTLTKRCVQAIKARCARRNTA